jgi:hypothetical protein
MGQPRGTGWADRLSELAEYRKIHGHCNVPYNYSENAKLATWVTNQRSHYGLHEEEKKSSLTLSRINVLESLGFEWDSRGTAWADRLSELAEYHKIHGHCNVPMRYKENSKLAKWVSTQRSQYMLHRKGKPSSMTLSRIQILESLDFEWERFGGPWDDRLSELADYRKVHGHCKVPQRYSENVRLGTWVSTQRKHYKLLQDGKKSPMSALRIQALESLAFKWTVSAPKTGKTV